MCLLSDKRIAAARSALLLVRQFTRSLPGCLWPGAAGMAGAQPRDDPRRKGLDGHAAAHVATRERGNAPP